MSRAHPAAAPTPAATIVIERLAGGGDGVGHVAGKVAFVPLTAPGDVVQVTDVEQHRTFIRARAARVVRASPDRVEPTCPAFGRCGGCSWQHLAYPLQLDAKRSIVEDALRRIGRLAPPPVPVPLPSPRQYGYRHRARLHAARRGAGVVFGFFAAGSTTVVPLTGCPVLHPSLGAVLRSLAAAAALHPEPFARCVAARADTDWSGSAVRLMLRAPGDEPLLLSASAAHALREGVAGDGITLLLGDAAGAPLRLGPGDDAPISTGEAFTQVNLAQNQMLVALAVALAAPQPGEEVLDLCCGLGNLSLPLAATGARVTGVDLDAAAVGQAQANALRLGNTATFTFGDAASVTRELAAAGRRFPLVVVNPPRTGARETAAALTALAPGRIVVVSCDPATLARDAAILVAGGYRLSSLRPIDLFPQTAHVETIALLERSG